MLSNVTSEALRVRWEAMLKEQLELHGFALPMLPLLGSLLPFITRSGITVKKSVYDASAQHLKEARSFRSLPHALLNVSAEAQSQLLGGLEVDLREHLEVHRVVPQVCALLTSRTKKPLARNAFLRGLRSLKHCPVSALSVVASLRDVAGKISSPSFHIQKQLFHQHDVFGATLLQTILERLEEFDPMQLLRFHQQLVMRPNPRLEMKHFGEALLERVIELIKQEPVPHEIIDRAIVACMRSGARV